MIDHHINLSTSEELSRPVLRAWFRAVKENAPEGTLATTTQDGKSVQLVKTKSKSGNKYSIPLTRDLTEKEVKTIIDSFSHNTDADYSISASTTVSDHKFKTDVEVKAEPMLDLCTKWAKAKHESWKKNQEGKGWRYGTTVSKENKTHPLIRSWDDIPAEYRKVDTKPAQELLDLLHQDGYVLVHRDDLDHLMGD